MFGSIIKNDYFQWMYSKICRGRFADSISYVKLMRYLDETEFRYSIKKDVNRALDGVSLRRRFAHDIRRDGIDNYYLDGPCSVLEMMLALAIRMEEDIMDDPSRGDRTGQWFWQMINNLGLGSMTDDRFDEEEVRFAVNKLLDRYYDRDGAGGLFRVRGCKKDMRRVEIWVQMLWYLDTIA